jgi:hypothetical protein
MNIETWCGNLQNAQIEGHEKNRGNIISYLLTCLKITGSCAEWTFVPVAV